MKLVNFIVGAFYIAFGIYLWNHPLDTLATYSLFLGLIHLSGAIATLIYSFMKQLKPIPWGNIIVSFIIGFGILALPMISLTLLLWLFIFGFLGMSVYYLMNLLKNKEQKWYMVQLAIATIGIVYGILMLVNPITGFATLAKVLAFGVITNGVSYIFTHNEQ